MIRNAFFCLLKLTYANTEWALKMPRGVTDLSHETYNLHMLVFWLCVAIAIVVFGVMIYSLIMHRKSKSVVPAMFSHSTAMEIVWTLIPIIILVVMTVPTAKTMVRLENIRDPVISIVITAYQWKWHYEYQDEGFAYYSSFARASQEARQKQSNVDPVSVENYLLDVGNPVVVPRGAKVRLLLTSNDVIHSWWVPDLAIKKDAIPGLVNEIWFRANESGTYRGQCAELCNRDHPYIPVVVEVVEPEAYRAWVASHHAEQ